jgi:hypothetical protein
MQVTLSIDGNISGKKKQRPSGRIPIRATPEPDVASAATGAPKRSRSAARKPPAKRT